jgi:hypothetical protein
MRIEQNVTVMAVLPGTVLRAPCNLSSRSTTYPRDPPRILEIHPSLTTDVPEWGIGSLRPLCCWRILVGFVLGATYTIDGLIMAQNYISKPVRPTVDHGLCRNEPHALRSSLIRMDARKRTSLTWRPTQKCCAKCCWARKIAGVTERRTCHGHDGWKRAV